MEYRGSLSVREKMATAFLTVLVLFLSRVDCQQNECLQRELRNDTTVVTHGPLRRPVYFKPNQQQHQHRSRNATLCWRRDDDDDCQSPDTKTLNISNTDNEWQELKIMSAKMEEENMTVVVMGEDAHVFRGALSNTSHESQEDEGTGELKVMTSVGLLWAIGCHPPATDNDTDELRNTTPDAPDTSTASPTGLNTAGKSETGGNVWKTLAIITIILLLITVFYAIYRYLKSPSKNRSRRRLPAVCTMNNGREMKVAPAAEGGLCGSVSLTSNSNSLTDDHRRSRLPSVVTSNKGHIRHLSDGKKTAENMMAPSSTPSPVPPAHLPMPTSAPPIPKSSAVNASLTRPSYVPPPPLEFISNGADNKSGGGGGTDDSDDHDYDYLDLNMLKTQMERDKKKEEQMKREMDPTVTRHDSVNSLYETIPTAAQKDPAEEGIRTQCKDEETKKIEEGDQPRLTTYDSINSLYEANDEIFKERKVGKEGVKPNEKQKEDMTKKEKSETHGRSPYYPLTPTSCGSENSLYETVPITTDHNETQDEGIKTQSKEDKKDEKPKEVKEGEQPRLTTYDSINSLYEATDAIFKRQKTGEEVVTKPKEEQEEQEDVIMMIKNEEPAVDVPCRHGSANEKSLHESPSQSAADEDDVDSDGDDGLGGQQDGRNKRDSDGNEGSTDDKDEDNESENEDDESEVAEGNKNVDQENLNEGNESGQENTSF